MHVKFCVNNYYVNERLKCECGAAAVTELTNAINNVKRAFDTRRGGE